MHIFAERLWVVYWRRPGAPAPVETMPGYVAAFTEAAKAEAYMAKVGGAKWDISLVVSRTLPTLVRSLGLLGLKGFCLDPAGKGCGQLISFDEIDCGESP